MIGIVLGLAMGLVSALAINWSFFVQHGAANEVGALSLRRPLAALRALVAHPRWLLGYCAGWIGWIVYIAALRFAPLSLVQASASGGIAFLALLCHRGGRVPLTRREGGSIALALLGLALLGVSLASGIPVTRAANPLAVLVAIAVLVVVSLLLAGPLRRILGGGAALGIASGCAYTAADIGAKAAVGGRLLFVPLLLLCSVGGFVAQQLAFQRGSALSTVGLSTLAGSAFPILAGPIVFHEQIPSSVFGALRIAGFVAVVIGASSLARPQPDAAGSELPDAAVETAIAH